MEAFIPNLILCALLMPLVAAFFAILFRGQTGSAIAQILTMGGALAGFAGIFSFLYLGALSPVALPFGLTVSNFSAFFLAIIYLGVFLTSLYAFESLKHYQTTYSLAGLNTASALFILGMQVTVMAPSMLIFLLAWEVMSLAAYFLVVADRSPESLRAGFLYLIMTHIGFVAIMAGFFLLAGGNPWATWTDLATNARTLGTGTLTVAFFLLFAGFGSKAGLVPLHQWLPYAHPQAPSHSSALLSGVMLKVALFGFLQAVLLFPQIPLAWGVVVIVVGLVSAFFGVVHAAVESDVKRVLAWSSIENMGLIFVGVGILLVLFVLPPAPIVNILGTSVRLFVILHIVNHFLFKSGLFMAAGAVNTMTHSRDMDALGGLAQKWPLFSGVFLALALAAAAIPPLGTFFGEWLLLQSLALAIVALPWWGAASATALLSVIGLVGGLAIFTFVNMFASLFLGRARTKHAEDVAPMPFLLWFPSALAAVLLLVVSLVVVSGLARGGLVTATIALAPGAAINPWFFTMLLALIGILLLAVWTMIKGTSRTTDTWDCGQPLTPRMQYTATGFSAPIRFFFRSVVLSRKNFISEPVVITNPWIAKKRLEWSVSSFWEVWFYLPILGAILKSAHIVKRLQSGVLQMYLVLLVGALVVTMLIAL